MRGELVYLRKEALYYAIEAAKLEVRTSRGWHHKRNVGELRTLGGRLSRLKKQASAESEIAQVESEIRIQRSTRPRARANVEELLEMAQYRWHTVMFLVTEYLRSPGRYALLPSAVIHGLCDWLSFPEIGIHCLPETIGTVKRHFYIEHRNGRANRVYQWHPSRKDKAANTLVPENDALLEEGGILNSAFKCYLCGRLMGSKEIGIHLKNVEKIPSELMELSQDPPEIYRIDTDETLASWS